MANSVDATIKVLNLLRSKGDTFPVVFNLKPSSEGCQVALAPIDITAWVFTLTIDGRHSPSDGTTVLATIIGNITDGPNGIVEFAIPGSLAVGNHYYDVKSVDDSGYVKTYGVGAFHVTPNVNNP